MAEFVKKQVPSFVKRVTAKNENKFFTDAPASAPRVLLFTDKKETPAMFKSLSAKFKDHLVFGEISDSQRDLMKKYGVSKMPKLLVVKKAGEEPIIYDGKIASKPITRFLKRYVIACSGFVRNVRVLTASSDQYSALHQVCAQLQIR